MVQRIEYAVFADTTDQALLATVSKLIGHVHRSALDFKQMRAWLRDQGLWNKDTMPTLLALFDVRMPQSAPTSLGPWANRFFAADDADAQQTLIFERLLDQNTLLVKYVMEALDMEGGGRLHSTYELHRMLTSYVYPGEQVGLPAFQAWIKWMVASDRLKLIGIRWGLTDLGKEVVPKLRMIDVDEFLEEEEEEQQPDDDGEQPEQAAAPPTPAPAAPAPSKPAAAKAEAVAPAKKPASGTAPAKVAAGAAAPRADEEFPDLPPEAPPVDDSVFEKYAAQYEPEPEAQPDAPDAVEPTEVVARPPATRSTVAPSKLVRASTIDVGCSQDPLDRADLIEALRAHGRQNGLGGGSLLIAYGLHTRMATNEAGRHLFLAALLARLSVERPDGALCDLLIERVGGLGPVAVLLERPETLSELVVRWGFARGDDASRAIRTALLDAVIGGGTLTRKADTPTILAEAPSSEVLVGMLGQGLLRGAHPLAAFWLIREMVRVELWKQPAARDAAAIPSRANRMMAYRLRLIDTHFAGSTARLLEVARALCQLLPPGSVEAAAFDDLAPADHLRFDCPKVLICQEPCGWRAG